MSGPVCEECGCTIDERKPGHGHSMSPPCGNFVFEFNPKVIAFVKAQPPDATGKQLLDGWLKHIGVVKPKESGG